MNLYMKFESIRKKGKISFIYTRFEYHDHNYRTNRYVNEIRSRGLQLVDDSRVQDTCRVI